MPRGIEEEVREEVWLLVEHWGTPTGGMIAFDYVDWPAIRVRPEMPCVMFDEFNKIGTFWNDSKPLGDLAAPDQ